MKMKFLFTIYIFFIAYSCVNFVRGMAVGHKEQYFYQLRKVRISNTESTAKSSGSLLQCAAYCSQNADCWIAQWHENDELCEMFDYRLTVSLVYPIDSGSSAVTVLFGKPISVVHVQKNTGYFLFPEAYNACAALGGHVTDYTNMKAGHISGWLHVTRCSFMDTQYKYCPTQSNVPGCGNGLTLCGYGETADVLCTLDGYAGFV